MSEQSVQVISIAASVFLQALAAIIFGVFCRRSFKDQEIKRNKSIIATFFSLNTYISNENLRSYSVLFGMIGAIGAFSVIYFISTQEKLSAEVQDFVFDKLKSVAGPTLKSMIEEAQRATTGFAKPIIVTAIYVGIFYLQIGKAVSFVRKFVHIALGFRDDVQNTLGRASQEVLRNLNYDEVERKLKEKYDELAPRPRELVRDRRRLTEYQIMYFATFFAPQVGFNEAVKQVIAALDCNPAAIDDSVTWDFSRSFTALALYVVSCCLYVAAIPALHDYMTPWNWPSYEQIGTLGMQVVRMSLQVAAPLLIGMTIYEVRFLRTLGQYSADNRQFEIAALQLCFALMFGVAFNAIDLFRTMSGDLKGNISSLVNLVLDFVLISSVAPVLLFTWIGFHKNKISLFAVFMAMVIGGGLFSIFEFRSELMSKKMKQFDMYFIHDALLGAFIAAMCFILWRFCGGLVKNSRSSLDLQNVNEVGALIRPH